MLRLGRLETRLGCMIKAGLDDRSHLRRCYPQNPERERASVVNLSGTGYVSGVAETVHPKPLTQNPIGHGAKGYKPWI